MKSQHMKWAFDKESWEPTTGGLNNSPEVFHYFILPIGNLINKEPKAREEKYVFFSLSLQKKKVISNQKCCFETEPTEKACRNLLLILIQW